MEEPKSALQHLRHGVNPITAVTIAQRERAHYNFTQHLQSVIRDAMMHVTPEWNDNLQDISEKLAVTALQKMKHSITLEECEAIFSESGLRAANPTAPSR